MEKICINGRDALFVLDLAKVACFKADTDYTTSAVPKKLLTIIVTF